MDEDFNISKLGGDKKPQVTKVVKRAVASQDTVNIKKVSGTIRPLKRKGKSKDMIRQKRGNKRSVGKRLLTILGVFLVVIVILGVVVAIPARKIAKEAQDVAFVGQEAAEAVKSQDLELAEEKLKETKKELEELQDSYKALAWTGYIPVVGGYYKDGDHGLKAANEFLQAGEIAVTEITPYSDLLGLSEGDSSFVEQPADQRIEMAISTFDKVTPKLGEIAEHLDAGNKELDQINPKRYPESFRGQKIRPRIEQAQEFADQTIGLFVNAQPLLELLPEMMGMEEEKRYLLLFQNDKELRPTGGFITAYAVLKFDKGKMSVESSSNIYDLDDRQISNLPAAEEVTAYHKGVYYAYLRDSNLSPDFYESMQNFEEILENVSNPPKYDGIIAMDTEVLVATIDILDGDIFVPEYGENFTTEPDDRCEGCPMVIYELSDMVGRRIGHVRENRKDVLGKLMFALMQKALGVSPSVYWGPLTQTFFDQINEKHIMFYMKDETTQQALESVNFAGRIQEYDGDYLHISDANMAGAKANLFVEHSVTQKIDIDKDGSVTKTVTLDYKNPTPQSISNCNLEDEGLCLNAPLRNWLRLYVPEGSELVSFEGSETEVVTKEELGKTVYEGFFIVYPEGSSKITVTYKLPFKAEDEYRMLIQKQPGTKGHEYTIILNGKEKDVLELTTDKELIYSL